MKGGRLVRPVALAALAAGCSTGDAGSTVDALGDGCDVNDWITMTGGAVTISGSTSGGNGALDHYGSFEVRSGLLVTAGSIDRAQGPSASSMQHGVMVNLTSPAEAGALLHVETVNGDELLTFAPAKAYQSIAFSSPKLKGGATYVI